MPRIIDITKYAETVADVINRSFAGFTVTPESLTERLGASVSNSFS